MNLDKIKQLVNSSSFEDNRLALEILMANFTLKELLDIADESGALTQFGKFGSGSPNAVCNIKEEFVLFHSFHTQTIKVATSTLNPAPYKNIISNLKKEEYNKQFVKFEE